MMWGLEFIGNLLQIVVDTPYQSLAHTCTQFLPQAGNDLYLKFHIHLAERFIYYGRLYEFRLFHKQYSRPMFVYQIRTNNLFNVNQGFPILGFWDRCAIPGFGFIRFALMSLCFVRVFNCTVNLFFNRFCNINSIKSK